MYKVTVYVTYKESVLDPQGEAVKGVVHRMGYESIEDIRIGKFFDIQVSKKEENVKQVIEEVCDKLLANVVMETYRYDIQEVEA